VSVSTAARAGDLTIPSTGGTFGLGSAGSSTAGAGSLVTGQDLEHLNHVGHLFTIGIVIDFSITTTLGTVSTDDSVSTTFTTFQVALTTTFGTDLFLGIHGVFFFLLYFLRCYWSRTLRLRAGF